MTRFSSLVLLSGILGGAALLAAPFAGAQSDPLAGGKPALSADIASGGPNGLGNVLPPLPGMPHGRTTVIGGVIRKVDAVRDQITLDVYGSKSMKIDFDERTHAFRDGQKTPVDALRPGEHASVETVLDGTDVFAQSIHMLSQTPGGECQGQVLGYDPSTRQLTVRDALSQTPIRLIVPNGASIARVGQPSFAAANVSPSDLSSGSLVKVAFNANNQGGGIASQITILASPGAQFIFTGNVAFLDMHANTLVVQDPRDDQSYKISFNPSQFPVSHDLHEGNRITVKASFNGSGYVASDIAKN